MAGLRERLDAYPRVVADLHDERATLFVGAGFSGAFRELPDWDELVGQLWTEVGRKATATNRPKDLYLQMSQLAELHWLASEKRRRRPTDGLPDAGVLKRRIRRIIDEHLLDHPDVVDAELWQRVLDLRFADWVTTNWDDLLERSMDGAIVMRRGQQLDDLARQRRLRPGMLAPTPDRPFVIKIHGCLTLPRGMVVTREDMDDFLQADLYLRSLLVKRFIEQTIVYLGYSLRDDNIVAVIEGVRDEVVRLAPDTPSNQLLLYHAPAGRVLSDDEERRHRRLTELGVAVEPYSGFGEFVTVVESLRAEPPPSLAVDDLAASLLDVARRAGEMRKWERRSWIHAGREGRDPPLRESTEWFLADVLPDHRDATLDQWADVFERLVHTTTASRRMIRYMGPPTDPAHYRVAIRRLTREIATHVAANQDARRRGGPLDRIIRTLDGQDLKGPARLEIIARDLAHHVDDVRDPDARAFFERRGIRPGKRGTEHYERARANVAAGIHTVDGRRRYEPVVASPHDDVL